MTPTEPTITRRPDGYHVVTHPGGSDPFPTLFDAERFVESLKNPPRLELPDPPAAEPMPVEKR